MLKKDLLMSLVVALNAVRQEKHKPEITVAEDILVNHAKCSQLFVLPVEKKQLYHSNLLVISQYIAEIAINLAHATIGKSIIIKTFPSLIAGKVFAF
ncbi:MAG: hypothetical protein JL57_31870 [Desulfosporosinus sp. BICA1-9]|nr:MAG: hypothetical protein JL57_31870 [Desulfosporosinus sp. BICA1-9]